MRFNIQRPVVIDERTDSDPRHVPAMVVEVCDICGALVPEDSYTHSDWHEEQR